MKENCHNYQVVRYAEMGGCLFYWKLDYLKNLLFIGTGIGTVVLPFLH